jgi:hypothetical protein
MRTSCCINCNFTFYVYGFRMILAIDIDYCPEHSTNLFRYGEMLYFLCGTDWILKYYLDKLRLERVNTWLAYAPHW